MQPYERRVNRIDVAVDEGEWLGAVQRVAEREYVGTCGEQSAIEQCSGGAHGRR